MSRKAIFLFPPRVLCFRSAHSLSVNFLSDRGFSIRLCGQPLSVKRCLNFEIFSSNVVSEEYVRTIRPLL